MALTTLPNNAMNFTENQQGNAILEKLRSQRDSGRFCDVVLHVQGKQFQAHRNILAACSPYFDSIFKMHKIVKEQLTITCQNHEVFQLLLNYMYTGTVVIDKNNVVELLRLANHFLVSKLKNYCAEYLDRYLDVTNCLSVKEMAEKYNMPALVKNATHFVQSNISSVLQQNEVLEFPSIKIETFLSDKSWSVSQDTLFSFVVRWVRHDIEQRERDMRNLLTFIHWSALDKNTILFSLDNEPLYRENQRCLYFVLQNMCDNDWNLGHYQPTYQVLKSKYSQESGQFDNDAFLNLAISTAIEGFHDDEPPKDTVEVEPFIPQTTQQLQPLTPPSPPPQPQFQNVSSALKCELETKDNIRDGLRGKKRLVREMSNLTGFTDSNKFDDSAQNVISKNPLKLRITRLKQKSVTALHGRKRKVGRPKKVPITAKVIHLKTSKVQGELRERKEVDLIVYENLSLESFGDDSDYEEMSNGGKRKRRSSSSEKFKDGIKCPHCCYIAHGSVRLEQHITKAHSKDVTYQCKLCDFECKWNREYYMHMKIHFDGPPFKCDSCDYTCDRIQLILTHRMKHTDERPYQCESCQYRCRTKNNLVAHMRSHTGEKPFKCEHCGRSFAIKSTLDQHLATHSADRPFLCDTCGFSTKYQSHLISHKRIHTGDVYRCQYQNCTYSTPKKSQLAAHMRTHTAIRSHICSLCGRGFIEKSHLVRHERIHLNDKPFKCDMCDYGSSRRDKLKEHVLKHHGVNATAKTPYKPRRPRRQNFEPFPITRLAAQPTDEPTDPMPHDSSSYSFDVSQNQTLDISQKTIDQRALEMQRANQTIVLDPRLTNMGVPNMNDQRNNIVGMNAGGNLTHSTTDFSGLSAFMALF